MSIEDISAWHILIAVLGLIGVVLVYRRGNTPSINTPSKREVREKLIENAWEIVIAALLILWLIILFTERSEYFRGFVWTATTSSVVIRFLMPWIEKKLFPGHEVYIKPMLEELQSGKHKPPVKMSRAELRDYTVLEGNLSNPVKTPWGGDYYRVNSIDTEEKEIVCSWEQYAEPAELVVEQERIDELYSEIIPLVKVLILEKRQEPGKRIQELANMERYVTDQINDAITPAGMENGEDELGKIDFENPEKHLEQYRDYLKEQNREEVNEYDDNE